MYDELRRRHGERHGVASRPSQLMQNETKAPPVPPAPLNPVRLLSTWCGMVCGLDTTQIYMQSLCEARARSFFTWSRLFGFPHSYASRLIGPKKYTSHMLLRLRLLHVSSAQQEKKIQQRRPAYHVWGHGNAWKCNIRKRKMVCQGHQTPRRKSTSTRSKNVAKEFVEPWGHVLVASKEPSSCVTDDDASALLAEHTPLFGLWAPVPAFLSTEEAEHARGFLR